MIDDDIVNGKKQKKYVIFFYEKNLRVRFEEQIIMLEEKLTENVRRG